MGAIRKVPWEKSGERIVSAEPGTAACQGISETGTLTDAQQPTWLEHATQFKQVITRFQHSRKFKRMSQLGDDIITLEDLRNWAIKHNALEMNKMMLENADTWALATTSNWPGKDGFESLDRIINCDEVEDDLGGTGNNKFDPWTKYESAAGGTVWDRDGVSTYDAVCVHGDGTYVAGSRTVMTTDGTLALGTIDHLIDLTQDAGAKRENQVFFTNRTTARRWAQLISPKQRFDNYERMAATVNGVQGVEGRRAGFRVAFYDDIPIITDKNIPEDGIGRIYLVDMRSLFFKVATPTFLMSPQEAESYLGLDKLVQDNWFLTEGELWCTNPFVQGVLRSLK